MKKSSAKIWILVAAVVLLLGIVAGALFATGVFGSKATIKPDFDDIYFEFGKKINLPDTTVFDGSGKEIAYDSTCIAMIAPDGTEVDVSSGFVTPMQEGIYVLTYESVSMATKTEIKIECRDTINPTLSVEIPDAYLIKEKFEDTEYTVHTLPILSADDLAGIDSTKTEVKITVGGKEIPLNGDQFTLTEEGDMVFTFTVYDLNGLHTTVIKESLAELPEYFDTYCLSTFAKDTYLTKLCGGWLSSWYTASILESDTDPSGNTMEGVLKITYDSSDIEAGACIHLARPVKLDDAEYLAVTLRLENAHVTAEVVDAVFYEADYREGFWTAANVSATVGSSYKTIYIGKDVLGALVDEDGYIREFQIETFGDNKMARSLYIADVSYGPKGSKMPENSSAVNGNTGTNGGTTGNLADNFPEYCLSTFAKEAYKNHMCGGWLNSSFTSKILSSDTDPSGNTMEGVVKITYPASDIEASACIHLGRAIKRSDVKSIEVTLRIENGATTTGGTVDAVFYKSNYKEGFWTTNNLSTYIGKNYFTVSLDEGTLNEMMDSDGYIRQMQIETFGDGKVARSLYIADISYTPVQNQSDEPLPDDALIISDLGAAQDNVIYFNINVETGLDDWTNIADLCNEETHILINDKAWSNQELGAISGKSFYINNLGAKVGTKLTIKQGFTVTFQGASYVTYQEYNYWWNGTTWTTDVVDAPDEPELPELPELPESCLSAFNSEHYLQWICGGWLNSTYDASILDSDTDSSGNSMEGVVKITYPASDIEAGACIHLARAIKRADVKSIEVILRIENGATTADGTVDAVFYKANYTEGFWTTNNLSAFIGKNYFTVSLDEGTLNEMMDSDGYIRQIQIETFGDGKVARSLYIADISYTPVGGDNPVEPPAVDETLIVSGVNGQNPSQLMMSLPVDPNVKVGTKMTVQSGLTVTIDGVNYTTAQSYDFWWNGTAWTTEEVKPDEVLTITGLGAAQDNIVYFNVNTETGVSDWENISNLCNEETHILFNDQPWSTQELGGINGPCFYISNIGATLGTKLTIKQGFTAVFNGAKYVTDKDYNYWWDGSTWSTEEVAVPDPALPELPENCLSAFDDKQYTDLLCGGWLESQYDASILDSDTDSAGNTQNGVLKITYPANDGEAGACIHFAEPVKREDVKAIQVTLRLENNGTTAGGSVDTVFYKADFYDGFWSTNNASVMVGKNYTTVEIDAYVLDTLVDSDGYIRKIQIETFGNSKASRSVYIADISYTPVSGSADPIEPPKTENILKITGLGAALENIVYFNINTQTGVADWTNIADLCNEETHILFNDVAWSTQELGGINGPCFYINNIHASVGTKLTIEKGFTATFNGIQYVTDKKYIYCWNGSTWIEEDDTTE